MIFLDFIFSNFDIHIRFLHQSWLEISWIFSIRKDIDFPCLLNWFGIIDLTHYIPDPLEFIEQNDHSFFIAYFLAEKQLKRRVFATCIVFNQSNEDKLSNPIKQRGLEVNYLVLGVDSNQFIGLYALKLSIHTIVVIPKNAKSELSQPWPDEERANIHQWWKRSIWKYKTNFLMIGNMGSHHSSKRFPMNSYQLRLKCGIQIVKYLKRVFEHLWYRWTSLTIRVSSVVPNENVYFMFGVKRTPLVLVKEVFNHYCVRIAEQNCWLNRDILLVEIYRFKLT